MKKTGEWSPEANALWEKLLQHQGEVFRTAKGLAFTYTIRGNELFVSRRSKSITRATVNMAAERAQAIMREAGCVDGPKKLGVFGASYLYPLLIRTGEITLPSERLLLSAPEADE